MEDSGRPLEIRFRRDNGEWSKKEEKKSVFHCCSLFPSDVFLFFFSVFFSFCSLSLSKSLFCGSLPASCFLLPASPDICYTTGLPPLNRAVLRLMFNQHDTDQSGTLDVEELRRWMVDMSVDSLTKDSPSTMVHLFVFFCSLLAFTIHMLFLFVSSCFQC